MAESSELENGQRLEGFEVQIRSNSDRSEEVFAKNIDIKGNSSEDPGKKK